MSANVPAKVVPGAFWKLLPDAVIYEASIPLTYKGQWPGNTDYDDSIDLENSYCQINRGSPSQTCEVAKRTTSLSHIVNKAINEFHGVIDPKFFLTTEENLTQALKYEFKEEEKEDMSIFNRRSRSKRGISWLGAAAAWCCNIATVDRLDGYALKQRQLEAKVEQLQAGLHQDFKNLQLTTEHFHDYDQKIHGTFREIEEHLHHIEGLEEELDNFTDVLSHQTFQNLVIQSQNLKRNLQLLTLIRKTEILSACKSKTIPLPVITPPILKADLTRLSVRLEQLNMQLAIPIENLSQYYKIPIADCAMSDHSLVIHLKIPITQRKTSWKLYELLTTPFGWFNDTCILMHETTYLAVSGQHLRPITGAGLHLCRPYDNKLCYIPRFSTGASYGPECTFKMYKGATIAELNKHCSYRCHTSRSMIISEVNEDTYVITHPPKSLLVNCPLYITPIQEKFLNQPGALQLHLPCNCSLQAGVQKLISPRFPCTGEATSPPQLIQIIPAVWTSLKTYKINPLATDTHPTYDNITEVLHKNWTLDVPHLNLSVDTSPVEKKKVNSDFVTTQIELLQSYADQYGHHSDLLLFLWNTALTLVVLKLLLQRPALIAAATPIVRAAANPTRTDTCKQTYYAYVGTTTFVLSIFAAYSVYRIYLWFSKRRDRIGNYQLTREGPPNNFELEVIREEPGSEPGLLTLPGGTTKQVLVTRVGLGLDDAASRAEQGP